MSKEALSLLGDVGVAAALLEGVVGLPFTAPGVVGLPFAAVGVAVSCIVCAIQIE